MVNIVDKKKVFRQDIALYALLILPVTVVFLFRYLPMLGLGIAFQDYSLADGIFHSEWVGFKWFSSFLSSAKFWSVFNNTITLSVLSIVFGFPAPIILALLLNEVGNKVFKRFTQTVSYLPHFLSVVVVVGLMTELFSPVSGSVNALLQKMGVQPIFFMASNEWFRPLYIISDIWQQIGWESIIYLAALTNIDLQLYEAAIVDGAGRWKQIIHITLPGIAPTIIILLLLRVGRVLDVGFEKVLLMYSPLTYQTADVIDTYVYRRGLGDMDFSFATAVGLFKSTLSLCLVITANRISKKIGETSLW